MDDKKITKVEIELLPVSRDNNGNPIIPLELINIKNKVKYIKEKTEVLLQLNKSTINEREIEIQIIKLKDYLDRLMNPILSLKNKYKEQLNKGYSNEKLKEEYGCTQEEWERNFTYHDEFDIEDSLRNYLKYLENNIKIMYSPGFSRYCKKGYYECKKHIESTKRNINSTTLFINGYMRLLINIENVIKDLKEDRRLDKTKKENLYTETSKSSIATYLNRLYTVLDSSSNEQSETIKGAIASIKNMAGVIKSEFGSTLFIRKAISFGSVRKAEKIFSMKKDEWDEFIENAERIDHSEFINKLVNAFENILEHAKNENFGKEAIDAIEEDIVNINDSKKTFFVAWEENINKAELGVRIEVIRYIPSDVKREVWQRDQGYCVQCGSRLNLEFDHIIPVSKGGSSTAKNIQLLCKNCNREKYNNI